MVDDLDSLRLVVCRLETQVCFGVSVAGFLSVECECELDGVHIRGCECRIELDSAIERIERLAFGDVYGASVTVVEARFTDGVPDLRIVWVAARCGVDGRE